MINSEYVKKQIDNTKIIAIIRALDFEDIDGVTDALVKGGIRAIEFTIDHREADCLNSNAKKIRYIKKTYGDQICVGAGTVINLNEAQAMIDVGAEYIVSPNADIDVIRYTKSKNVVSIPGAMTPTECFAAYEAGADYVKLFPAGELGLKYVKALKAPLNHIPFLLVGGIDLDNMKDFLDLGVKGFGLGSNLVLSEAVKQKNYKLIEEKTRTFILKCI